MDRQCNISPEKQVLERQIRSRDFPFLFPLPGLFPWPHRRTRMRIMQWWPWEQGQHMALFWGGGGNLPKVGFVWVDKQPGTALGGQHEAAASA